MADDGCSQSGGRRWEAHIFHVRASFSIPDCLDDAGCKPKGAEMNEILITIMLTAIAAVVVVGSISAIIFLYVLLRDFVCEELL